MNNIFICPHCNHSIIITKINCGIFRHGTMKRTGKQIHPHISKIKCDKLIKYNMIYGCGKPFQILQKDNNYEIQSCDYI